MTLSTVGLNKTLFFGVISVFCLLRTALSCRCTDLTIHDQRTGQPIGSCLTRAAQNGRFFCYVSATSDCFDRRPSARAHGLFWSSDACDGTVAPAAKVLAFGGRKKRSVMHEYSDYNDDSYKSKSQYGEHEGYDAGYSHSYQSEPIHGNNYEHQDYAKPKHEYSEYNDDTYKSTSQYGEHEGYDAGYSHSYQPEPIHGNNYGHQDYAKPTHEYSDYDGSYKSKSQYGDHKGYDAGHSHSYQSELKYGNNYEQQDYAKPKHEYSDYNDGSYKSKSQYGEYKGYDTGHSQSYPIEVVPEVSSDDGYGY